MKSAGKLKSERGLIDSAANGMRALQAAGLRIDEQTVRTALKKTVDEDW